ncbi:hypothetical protein PCE1_000078 [Barthelona sp. PCE]
MTENKPTIDFVTIARDVTELNEELSTLENDIVEQLDKNAKLRDELLGKEVERTEELLELTKERNSAIASSRLFKILFCTILSILIAFVVGKRIYKNRYQMHIE